MGRKKNKLRIGPDRTSLADNMLTELTPDAKKAGTAGKDPLEVPALRLERETGFEPATLSLGS